MAPTLHHNHSKFRTLRNVLISMFALGCLTLQAGLTWDFDFTDVGVGFNDPVHGAARRGALHQAVSELSEYFVNYTAIIQIEVDGSITGNSALAGASSEYTYAETGFENRGDVMVKILGEADPDPGVADGYISWNFDGFDWELENDFQPGEFDFNSTMKHELLHTIGFLSLIEGDGSDMLAGVPPGLPGFWGPFDEFVADENGYIIDEFAVLDADAWNTASVGGTGEDGLRFLGPNAVAANGGNPLYLYSPGTWSPGSSGSHLDDDFYFGTYLMESASPPGPGIRELDAVEIGVLKDIGYTQVIPEVGTPFLMGISLAAILLVCRLSRTTSDDSANL